MKPLPHHYDVRVTGGPFGYGELSSGGLPNLKTAPPPAFDGPGDVWSPEHLLLASVQACFLFTLRAVARMSRVEFGHVELEATGTVDRNDGITRFSEIVLRPRVTVEPGMDHDRVLMVLTKTKKDCLVSASLSTEVRLAPEILEAPLPALCA